MRLRFALLVVLTAGCTATNTVETPAPIASASVEVVAEGGIAALSVRDRVDRDTRGFVHVMRHVCAANCGAPIDSASGVAAPAVVDSLFNGVLAQKFLFQDDYGLTQNAADMMVYTVRITSNGTTKTVRADDGTMPGALHQIVDAVRATAATARK